MLNRQNSILEYLMRFQAPDYYAQIYCMGPFDRKYNLYNPENIGQFSTSIYGKTEIKGKKIK